MVYVIVLNWKGALDTIACADAVLRLKSTPFQLVICDNASEDDSIARLRRWAANRGGISKGAIPGHPEEGEGRQSALPQSLLELPNDRQAWRHAALPAKSVVLIHTGANLGFAGGNNVGLRYALERGDAEFFWILNNDTAVSPNALTALMTKARNDSAFGLVGSTLLYYYSPDRAQVLGGCRFSAWTTQIEPIGWGKTATEAAAVSESEVEARLDYVTGASMLVSKAFVEDVGLMQEDYFLYFEEIDWAERGRRSTTRKWKLGYARDSVVFHKVGATAGTGSSTSATRYFYTSKIRFMKRFYPGRLPLTVLLIFLQAMKRLSKGAPSHALAILSVLVNSHRIEITAQPERI